MNSLLRGCDFRIGQGREVWWASLEGMCVVQGDVQQDVIWDTVECLGRYMEIVKCMTKFQIRYVNPEPLM